MIKKYCCKITTFFYKNDDLLENGYFPIINNDLLEDDLLEDDLLEDDLLEDDLLEDDYRYLPTIDYYFLYDEKNLRDIIKKLQYDLNISQDMTIDKDLIIYNLNNRIEIISDNMINMNNNILWYTENYQQLLDDNNFLRNDNKYIKGSLLFSIPESNYNSCTR
jgi:hypothetical protein